MTYFHGSRHTYLAVTAANIIAFISGTSIAWSSPIIAILEGEDLNKIPLGRQITPEEESWIGSLASMGGIFGPFIFGFLMEILGRKLTVASVVIPFLSAYLISAFAETVELYYVARILMGMGVGGAYCTIPIYVAETSEDINRGLLQASTSTCIMLGILFSYCLGPYVSIMAYNLVLSGICIIYVPIFLFASPESPYYLISKNRDEDAMKSLSYLRHKPNNEVEKELEDIKSHLKRLKPGSFLDIFKTKGTVKAFSYSVALTTFQQLSGVIVISYFTQNIFDATGSDIPPEVCSIIVGSVQLFVSCISPPFLDRAGRRFLLLIAVTGAIIAEVLMGVYFYLQKNNYDVSNIGWLPVFSLVMYFCFYNFGMGAIPWTMMGELLPSNIISKAALLATSFYWVSGFFLAKYFGELSINVGMAGSFWLFAGFCVLWDLFTYFLMFETKGKSFAEIQNILNR